MAKHLHVILPKFDQGIKEAYFGSMYRLEN